MQVAIIAPTLAVRTGLRALLGESTDGRASGDSLDIVYEAPSLLDLVDGPQVDILVISEESFSEPELEGIASREEGRLALLLITERAGGIARKLAGMPLRAWGVLTPDATAEELGAAVFALHQGLLVGAPELVGEPLVQLLASKAGPEDPLVQPLTEREGQVLELLARGLANKQIAVALAISEHTVKFHVSSIYNKLGATNRAEAVRTGIQQGLVSI